MTELIYRGRAGADAGRAAARALTDLAWMAPAAALLGAGWGSNQFTPMLLVYGRDLGLGTGTLEAMFGFYALGLIPGLLIAGPLSDACGRRPVVLAAAGTSLAATLVLIAGADSVALLFAGRLLTGISVGAVFSAGTAWLRETSSAPFAEAGQQTVARRAAVAMTTGFLLGPLLAGLLAQWAPDPRVLPYLPHVALMAIVLALLRGAPETIAEGAGGPMRLVPPEAASPRFRRVVAPMAPWVFVAPGVAFAFLPTVVHAGDVAGGIALTAAITALTALAGVLVQPIARRLGADERRNPAATVGLLTLAVGLALAAATAGTGQIWMLVPSALVFGAAYGLGLVAGLVEVQGIADRSSLAGLTAVFYALTYLGFAAPFVLALAGHFFSYPTLLAIASVLALATAGLVTRRLREGGG